MDDLNERQRMRECTKEIESAMIATLDDLRPKLIAKYKLSAESVETVLGSSSIRVAVHLTTRNSPVPERNVRQLLNHVCFMIEGCVDNWTVWNSSGEEEVDDRG